MLGESFIQVLKYRQEDTHLPDISRQSFTPSAGGHHSSFTLAQEDVQPSVQPAAPGVRHELGQYRPEAPRAESPVGVKCSLDTVQVSDLDLQLSRQLHPGSTADRGPCRLRSIPTEWECVPGDGYLVMDSSIMLNGEPPTNSMLNGYLDKKLCEVYSQYLQERLACPGCSPACSMLPPLSQASLLQLSQHLNLEPSLEPGQGPLSQWNSSHFSSPLLRISSANQPKYPRPPDYL